MHSYQPSRSRIFFQVLCALGISAGLAGAWMQTGATGLAVAAIIGALYGLVHISDLFRRKPATQVEPQRIDFDVPLVAGAEPADQISVPDPEMPRPQLLAVDDEQPVRQVELVEPASDPAKVSRPGKVPRKGGNRRVRAAKGPASTGLPPTDEARVEGHAPSDPSPPNRAPEPFDALPHTPAAPLFEPESFVRLQQRGTFGRKAS